MDEGRKNLNLSECPRRPPLGSLSTNRRLGCCCRWWWFYLVAPVAGMIWQRRYSSSSARRWWWYERLVIEQARTSTDFWMGKLAEMVSFHLHASICSKASQVKLCHPKRFTLTLQPINEQIFKFLLSTKGNAFELFTELPSRHNHWWFTLNPVQSSIIVGEENWKSLNLKYLNLKLPEPDQSKWTSLPTTQNRQCLS